jgi:hypothetical protein
METVIEVREVREGREQLAKRTVSKEKGESTIQP